MNASSGEGQQTPTELDLAPIRRRWSRYGGMGNDRSADDYTDKGCRRLAESGFHDVPLLVAEVERLRSQLDDARGKAGRLEKELNDKSQEALRIATEALDGVGGSNALARFEDALEDVQSLFAGPSSVAEFEALGTPVEDKK